MEVGIGHHGEPGVEVTDLKSAAEIAQLSLDHILPDLPFSSGDDVVALVSGLGATPVMESYIAYSKIFDVLKESGIKRLSILRRELLYLSRDDGHHDHLDEIGR